VLVLSALSALFRYLITGGPHLLWVALNVLFNPESLPTRMTTPQQQVGSSCSAAGCAQACVEVALSG
jgi:hypothetical protein